MIKLTLGLLKEIVECMDKNGVSINADIFIETTPFSDNFSIGTKDNVVKYDYALRCLTMQKRKVLTGLDTDD